MSRIILAVAVVALLSVLAVLPVLTAAKRVNGVGYDTDFPANRNIPYPHLKTPVDTKLISTRYPKEAQLACVEQAPVNRIVLCDILTWDGCGNVYGREGNHTHWEVEVRNGVTGKVVRLLAPVMHLEEGVHRFYFTPVETGAYVVKVWRDNELKLQSLHTPETLEQIVVIHDTTAKCTSSALGNTHPILRQLLWAQVSITNELKPIIGVDGISKNTNIAVDYNSDYNVHDAKLQAQYRRPPVPPNSLQDLGDIPREDNNNFQLCDVIQQS